MADRKIISKIVTGSYMYGTFRLDSDRDYQGVFLPSTDDLLGLQGCPSEWSQSVKKSAGDRNTVGDVDCKFFSLQRFFNLAGQGQPGQLELLFSTGLLVEQQSLEWKLIVDNRALFLSRKGIAPFVGFALAQAHKTSIKGDNLNLIRRLTEWCRNQSAERLNLSLTEVTERVGVAESEDVSMVFEPGLTLPIITNDHGFGVVRVAGRDFDIGAKTKFFMKCLEKLEFRYGKRSEAAAANGLDFKSLMHAYRLLFEAKEFLQTGSITLPRPPDEIELLKKILNKQLPEGFDFLADIESQIDYIRKEIEPNSPLPEQPDWSQIGQLCRVMLGHHIRG